MTLKANYFHAFIKMFLLTALIFSMLEVVLPYYFGKNYNFGKSLLVVIFLGCFFGIFSIVFFTPLEISWNNESFSIKRLLSGTREYSWSQLEGYHTYSRFKGSVMIKFHGQRTFRFNSFGFLPAEWKEFQLLLNTRFPEKKKSQWLLI